MFFMVKESDMPRIVCVRDGPLVLIKGKRKSPVPLLVDEEGNSLSDADEVALCRCGRSKNMPFCDGTHAVSGYTDGKETDGKYDCRRNYAGKDITVHFNKSVCDHAGYCVCGLPSVFRKRERPWVCPDCASADEIIAVIRKCPSGALSYSVDGIEHRDPEINREPQVIVRKRRPYEVVGSVELEVEEWAEEVSREHYTLCRCGKSKNKPFCDGTHRDSDFEGE